MPLFQKPHFFAPRLTKRQKRRLWFMLIPVFAVGLLVPAVLYFRELAGRMAISDATDIVTLAVNKAIRERMADGDYDYNYFVTLDRDNDGEIVAIMMNMSRVNDLSSAMLSDVVSAADSGQLDLHIPVGDLLGSNLLLGRGPEIPVLVTMLTSSCADFRNDLSSAGINQTKHQILLELIVDIDVLLPWEVLSTQIVSEVLVAETIIVGKVPETYMNWEG